MAPLSQQPGEPAHDATGIVLGTVLGLLLWPVIFVLAVAASAVWL